MKKINARDILKRWAVLIVLIVLVAIFSMLSPNFRTFSNMIVILRQVSMLAIVASGMAIVLISGGIDLSVGSTLSLVGVVTASSAVNWGINPVISILIGLAVGILIGFLNGFIITKTGMPPIIATLAMYVSLAGLAFIIVDGTPVYGIPEWYLVFGQGYIGTIPVPVIIMIVLLAICSFLLNKTYIGRYFFAVGSNEEATRLSGINTNKVKIIAYTISGFLASIAAIIMLSRVNSGQPRAGVGFELDALTACVVGGVSISGGEGKISQVIIGTLIIGVLSNGLVIAEVSEYWQQVAKGFVLILAVAFDSIQKLRNEKSIAAIN